jgi:hypothetical protein
VEALGARIRATPPTPDAAAHEGLHQPPRVQLLPRLEAEDDLALRRGGGGEGGEVLVRAAATGGLSAAAEQARAGGR